MVYSALSGQKTADKKCSWCALKYHGSKVGLYIGNDITNLSLKNYVRHAIELHEKTGVPLEIYIKGELKNIDEVKRIVEE